MTSSIRRSDSGLRSRIAVLLCLVGAAALAHLSFEGASLASERYLGAYLWKHQDYLRLFSPANHVNRGRGRIYLYGPSEAREGLLPEEIDRLVPGWHAYQGSQSVGTLEDALVVLRYLEGAYGESAVPEALLLGITPRFVGNVRPYESPLVEAINKYSPHFSLIQRDGASRLEPKPATAAFAARWALLSLAPDRYRRALVSIAGAAAVAIAPAFAHDRRRLQLTMPAKYLDGKYYPSPAALQRALTVADRRNTWPRVHVWDVDVERVSRELREVMAFVERYDRQVFVVNLPEHSMNRAMFDPNRYDTYLATVRSAIGATPFLDLRTLLSDDDFWDEMHPTWKGGVAVSRAVAAFVAANRRFPRESPQ